MNRVFSHWLQSGVWSQVGSYRGDCPACGGHYSFSVANVDGALTYNCFRSSCEFHGATKADYSFDVITDYFKPKSEDLGFTIPEHFVSGKRAEVIRYLNKNNSLEAFYDGRAEVRYDPKQDRAVFMIKDGDNYVGAVGRGLSDTILPKWFVYGPGGHLFVCPRNQAVGEAGPGGSGLRCALVEDCASACSASRLLDGISLLGTNIQPYSLGHLVKYETVYVCLDKDASTKAIQLQRSLSYYLDNVQVKLLERDLKYYDDVQELERFFNANESVVAGEAASNHILDSGEHS